LTVRRALLAGVLTMGCAAEPPGAPPAGWTVAGVPGKRTTVFSAGPDGVITIQADQSVGFLVRETPDARHPAQSPNGPRLTWRWRVKQAPPPVPPDAVGRDDRPAAVHVVFARTQDGEGAMTGLRRWFRGAAVHEAFAGRTITYMWGGTLPAGTRLPNPYLRQDGWIIVLRGSETPLGEWRTETIDPMADYRALFGVAAPALTHLVLSADTEDSGGCALSQVEPPRFVAVSGGSR